MGRLAEAVFVTVIDENAFSPRRLHFAVVALVVVKADVVGDGKIEHVGSGLH